MVSGMQIEDWAVFGPNYNAAVLKLKGLLLDEQWYYGKEDERKYPSILSSYLKWTFYRIYLENKIVIFRDEKDEYAVFNTGLVNPRYMELFALFSRNKETKDKWKLSDFCVNGEGQGKILARYVAELPKRANYYENRDETFYDTSIEIIQDYKHFFIKNIGRLPAKFIRAHHPKNFQLQETREMDIHQKREYFFKLGTAIKNDNETFLEMQGAFNAAFEIAKKRIDMNFRIPLPMYYPEYNSTSLLIPIGLIDHNRPDVAIVVEKQPSGKYQGQTILSLAQAYSNARLVAKPESSWLRVDKIKSSDTSSRSSQVNNNTAVTGVSGGAAVEGKIKAIYDHFGFIRNEFIKDTTKDFYFKIPDDIEVKSRNKELKNETPVRFRIKTLPTNKDNGSATQIEILG